VVSAVPYDVVDTLEARALAEVSPYSLLRVSRPEIHFPDGTNPYGDAVYAKAREEFLRLQKEGALLREPNPCMFLYRQSVGTHAQRGLMALCHIEDYENDIIKKHEKTRKDKEDDRTRITSDLNANLGPVFLTYRDMQEIHDQVRPVESSTPLFDFTAPDGVQHTVWRIADGTQFRELFAQVPCAYVADGHHRAASAARVGRERRRLDTSGSAEMESDWFLAVLFPASELNILPYHRLVLDANGLTPDQILEKIRAVVPVQPCDTPDLQQPGQCSLYLQGRWHRLSLIPTPTDAPADKLDVAMLQSRILSPIFGIDDPRTSPKISFVGGVRGIAYLQAQVDTGKAVLALAMAPVTVNQLMDIADAGQIMPPKSTWFEPKLRSGLAIHTFGL
jgi:uncharacterized protein (DUF1015 family)